MNALASTAAMVTQFAAVAVSPDDGRAEALRFLSRSHAVSKALYAISGKYVMGLKPKTKETGINEAFFIVHAVDRALSAMRRGKSNCPAAVYYAARMVVELFHAAHANPKFSVWRLVNNEAAGWAKKPGFATSAELAKCAFEGIVAKYEFELAKRPN